MWRSHVRGGPTSDLHEEFITKAKEFVQRCQPEKEADIEGNPRGNHWFCIAGYDRQNKTVSSPSYKITQTEMQITGARSPPVA